MQPLYEFEGFTLDVICGCLKAGDREIDLRPKSFEFLRYLVEHADRLVSKDEIMKAVWPNVLVTDDSLKRCLSDIRLALRDDTQRIIKTVPRRGYRFVAPVSRRTAAMATAAVSSEQIAGLPASVSPRLSIVVLPFANLSSDQDQDYFADGLTDSLTTDLSRIPGSFVIARHSAFTYKGKATDVKQIGRELGVRYALEGSVQKRDERIRINAQLIDAQTGSHLWAERCDRDQVDLLTVEDDITGRIARSLKVELVEAESCHSLRERPENPDAVDLAMRGWAIWYRDFTAANNEEARRLFNEALGLDPDLVTALVGLARTHVLDLIVLSAASPAATFADWKAGRERQIRIADDAITKAIALEPRHAFAHVAKGLLLRTQGRLEELLIEHQHALELNHNEASAYVGIGFTNTLLGRAEEAIEILQHALRLDPRGNRSSAMVALGRSCLLVGHNDEAIEWYRRAIENNRVLGYPYLWLACALALKGRNDEASAALAAFWSVTPIFSLARSRIFDASVHPIFIEQSERLNDALRKIGVPEEG